MTTATDGYTVNPHPIATKRVVQTLSLRNSPELIAAYRRLHSPGSIWPEIVEGIREAGILEMDIFIRGCRLVMIVELPATLDWESAMTRLASLPRQAEWEATVARFQEAMPAQTSSEKWQPMERMFSLSLMK